MALFSFGKKKEEKKKTSCCCGSNSETASDDLCCEATGEIGSIKVLGAGCKSCHDQYKNVISAAAKMGLSTDIEYITDMEKVMAYGVMSMPAIVVNEKVVSAGKVLKTADVEKLLHKLERDI